MACLPYLFRPLETLTPVTGLRDAYGESGGQRRDRGEKQLSVSQHAEARSGDLAGGLRQRDRRRREHPGGAERARPPERRAQRRRNAQGHQREGDERRRHYAARRRATSARRRTGSANSVSAPAACARSGVISPSGMRATATAAKSGMRKK